MVRKSKLQTKKAGRRRSVVRGGGYSFGGSILTNPGGPNGGAPQWNSHAGSDCGAGDLQSRGGNNTLSGGRRRRGRGKGKKGGKSRRALRGGSNQVIDNGSKLALMSPRGGYTFNGSGVAGISDAVPYGAGPLYKI